MKKDKRIHPLDTFRVVLGGKPYDRGNHVYVLPQHRKICIEFDSDYTICKNILAKNFEKMARKEIEKIPKITTVKWLRDHGWIVPEEIKG